MSDFAGFISEGLKAAGFSTDSLHSGSDAREVLATSQYDAAVLDLGLPDIDGMAVLRELRGRRCSLPILILTARDGVGDRVAGLDAGADDYLLKPFAMEELVARVRALLRRPSEALGATLTAGNMALDTVTREFMVEGALFPLSRREFDLMEQLLRRVGRVVSKAAIDERLYGFGDEGSINAVEVIISRLRKSLRAANASPRILTFRGVGYMLQEAVE